MTVPQPRSRPRKPLDAGVSQPEIGSFRLHLVAEGKARPSRTSGRACARGCLGLGLVVTDAARPGPDRVPVPQVASPRSGRGLVTGPGAGPQVTVSSRRSRSWRRYRRRFTGTRQDHHRGPGRLGGPRPAGSACWRPRCSRSG